jgi:hypothetical protein
MGGISDKVQVWDNTEKLRRRACFLFIGKGLLTSAFMALNDVIHLQ